MIKLYQFAPVWGTPNVSMFCMKVETYLRLAKIPYEVVIQQRPTKGPKGKLPFIEDQGKIIGDSGLIIDYLKATYGDPLDQHLTSEQKGRALAIQRLLEEHLYWIVVYTRWVEPTGWKIIKDTFFHSMPALLKIIILPRIQKYMIKNLHAQGIGRHTPQEIHQMGKDDITAISALLGNKPFMLGDQVTSIDAAVYAAVANLLAAPFDSPLKTCAASCNNLVDYCERMKQKYENP